jgi:hypothetical protein
MNDLYELADYYMQEKNLNFEDEEEKENLPF